MTQNSSNQPGWWEPIQKFLENKFVNWGVPGVFLAIAAEQAKNAKWREFWVFVGCAIVAWVAIYIGSKVLPVVDRFVDWVLGDLIPKATATFSFESKYLECQMSDCTRYYTDDFDPSKTSITYQQAIRNPTLENVFVAVEISSDPRMPDQKFLQKAELKPELLDRETKSLRIWDFLAQSRRMDAYQQMVILAQGGFGKTTLLRHIAYTYAKRRHRRYNAPKLIPVLLYLRQCRNIIAQPNAPTLPELIHQHHIPRLPNGDDLKKRLPADWAQNLLNRGRALVMIDGFDEVAENQRQSISLWLSQQMRNYSRSVFILTSRPTGYRQDYSGTPLTELFLRELQPDQQQEFIRHWYLQQEICATGGRTTTDVKHIAKQQSESLIQQIEASQDLQRLAENPLLLNMIVKLHRVYPTSKLPDRRTDLYAEICQLQLATRPQAKGIEMLLEPGERQAVLQGVALDMLTTNQQPVIDLQPLLTLLHTHLQKLDDVAIAPKQFLHEIVQVTELLVDREQSEQYEFSHLSFQNYFAAEQLKKLGSEGETLLLQHCENASWHEAVRMYAALVTPTRVIQALCQREHPEIVELAYACWRESPRQNRVPASVVDELYRLRYQPLERYLQNGQWQEADQETYRLMIRSVGKEEGQYFTWEELKAFPCRDLRTIDQLWVTHSNGRFGFSVQKQLWLEVGGKLDFGEDGKAAWNAYQKMSDRNGWRVNNKFISYDDVINDTSAPVAHLPFDVVGFGGAVVVVAPVVGVFFSRIQTCEV
jgi:hypothetical protein